MNTLPDVIDAHVHLACSGSSLDQSALDDFTLQMDIAAVDVAVVFTVAPQEGISLTEERNTAVSTAVNEMPERLVGFCSVHPAQGKKAIQELERCCSLGLKGIKLHPLMQNFRCDNDMMHLLVRKAADLNMPILIHSSFPYDTRESENLYNLVSSSPDTNFILAHTGGVQFLDCYVYVEKRKLGMENVYFELSTLTSIFRRSPYIPQIKWLVEQMGADRVVFGSNYPHHQLVDALTSFRELELSYEDSQQILGKTLAHLLDL
ncbi:MAG: amidohydrolase family protein [Theionarchaea archaeon]|nr:amidohydrolase family protein [Theionarchaea archaeon]MBU7001083.1 amidohydrolase family protein [Theionarchaea archaeon]MBU7020572.1 amidohydrolase family protein [Theionarchaea archaeon]MBU7034221.1 amidohydrolase family protein [Theionarchaea archaeon]MBU7039295.1 amidohydrolase family protein [Theionarchaea archaeon]